jgi:WG containing repeat
MIDKAIIYKYVAMKIPAFFLSVFFLLGCNKADEDPSSSKIWYPIKVNNLWGYIDGNGEVKIEPKYSSANFMIDDVTLVSKGDSVILLNRTGYEIRKFLFDEAWPVEFYGNLLKIEHADSVYFYDTTGNEILALSRTPYFNVSSFLNCNRLLLTSPDGFCFIDRKGETKFKFKEGRPSDFDEESGLATIFFKNKTCFVDTVGNVKFCFKDERHSGFFSGLALIQSGKTKFFIDKSGKKVLNVSRYAEVSPFVGEMAEIVKAGKRGFIDKSGRELIPPIYYRVDFFSSGAVAVQPTPERKFYFIDQNNRKIIDQPFDYVESPGFFGDLAWVKKGNKQGWINKKGEFVWSEDNK